MNTKRYIFVLLALVVATVVPAQVIHLYESGFHTKYNTSEVESIEVAPASDYNISFPKQSTYYIGNDQRIHGTLTVEIGPDAVSATARMSLAGTSGNDPANITKVLNTGLNELDFILPKDNTEYRVEVTTSNAVGDTYRRSATLRYVVHKWRSLGMGTFQENFWWEEGSSCEILVDEADPTQFMVKDPFDNMPGISDNLTGRQTRELTFRILQVGESYANTYGVSSEGLVVYDEINLGYFHPSYYADIYMFHPSVFTSYSFEEFWKFNRVLSWQDGGHTLPGQVQLAPYYYMNGVGGWNHTQNDGIVLITFPGGRGPLYEADVYSDFEWGPLSSGDYHSGQLGTTKEVTLYKGFCINGKDNCGERFREQYGDVYQIGSPYTEGQNLIFFVKNGKLSIPEQFKRQYTGLNALGTDIYAYISESRSSLCSSAGGLSFQPNDVKLYIVFTNWDGSKVYGEATEEYRSEAFTTVGTADFMYTFFFTDEEGNPVVDEGLELQQSSLDPTHFRLKHWGYGVDFDFHWDQQTNRITVPANYTGYEHPSYGPVYVADWVNAGYGSYGQYPCTYDPATKTATLNLNYYVSAGSFGGKEEYMIIKLGEMPSRAPLKAKARQTVSLKGRKLLKGVRFGKVAKPTPAEKMVDGQDKASSATKASPANVVNCPAALSGGRKSQRIMMDNQLQVKTR